eukprot:TRINITY_DN1971_c0_g5_i1.p1 TRINITY_DN1971_c0_g5~~TRINITY_DN1971_c0_g5_i1.p1  ORF type:complete len:2199 (-),score=380.29 TRINITY_DN1971_c0_g5_i1:100-6696(-)
MEPAFTTGIKETLSYDKDSYGWNNMFQDIVTTEKGIVKYQKLTELYKNFTEAAKMYGRIIISERHLANTKKTYAPLSLDGSGVAGGEKYMVHGIYFKFALDVWRGDHWLYGQVDSHHGLAAKAAGHELKGVIKMFQTRKVAPKLHYPLLVLIDWHGYRMIALSLIPIGHNTLKYGSSDSGLTVHSENEELNEQMKLAGQELHLAGHHVGGPGITKGEESNHLFYLCGDIEGHLGLDGRFYVLDFARVFPAESLASEEVREIYGPRKVCPKINLVNLLRPELVHTFFLTTGKALCSDARSPWVNRTHTTEKCNCSTVAEANVRQATDYLIDTLVREFAEHLHSLSPLVLQSESLTEEIHWMGINCRQLGRIRSVLQPSNYKSSFLLVEICARSAKNQLQEYFRMVNTIQRTPCDPYIDCAKQYINRLLDDDSYWRLMKKGYMKYQVMQSFPKALTDTEKDEEYDLRISLFPLFHEFFVRFQDLSGVRINQGFLDFVKGCVANNTLDGLKGIEILNTDIEMISIQMKVPDLVSLYEGKMLFLQASKSATPEQSLRLSCMAQDRLRQAFCRNPNNPKVLLAWARVLEQQSQNMLMQHKKRILLLEADKKLLLCLELNPKYEKALKLKITILVQLAVHFDTYPQKNATQLHLPLTLTQIPHVDQKLPSPRSSGQTEDQDVTFEGREWEQLLEQQVKDASGKRHRIEEKTEKEKRTEDVVVDNSRSIGDLTEVTDEEREMELRRKWAMMEGEKGQEKERGPNVRNDKEEVSVMKTYLNSNMRMPTNSYSSHYGAIVCLRNLQEVLSPQDFVVYLRNLLAVSYSDQKLFRGVVQVPPLLYSEAHAASRVTATKAPNTPRSMNPPGPASGSQSQLSSSINLAPPLVASQGSGDASQGGSSSSNPAPHPSNLPIPSSSTLLQPPTTLSLAQVQSQAWVINTAFFLHQLLLQMLPEPVLMIQAADILIRNAVLDQSKNAFNRAGQAIESGLLNGAILNLKLPILGTVSLSKMPDGGNKGPFETHARSYVVPLATINGVYMDTKKRSRLKRFWCYLKQDGDNPKFVLQRNERDSSRALFIELKEIKELKIEVDPKRSHYHLQIVVDKGADKGVPLLFTASCEAELRHWIDFFPPTILIVQNGCPLRHDSIVDYGLPFSIPKDFLRRNYYKIEFKKEKKNTWREIGKERILVPTVHQHTTRQGLSTIGTHLPCSDLHHLFYPQESGFDIPKTCAVDAFLTFDFGPVQLTRVEVNLPTKTCTEENKGKLIAQLTIIALNDFLPLKELDKISRMGNITDFKNPDLAPVVVKFDIPCVQHSQFHFVSYLAGRCFFFRLANILNASVINVNQVVFSGISGPATVKEGRKERRSRTKDRDELSSDFSPSKKNVSKTSEQFTTASSTSLTSPTKSEGSEKSPRRRSEDLGVVSSQRGYHHRHSLGFSRELNGRISPRQAIPEEATEEESADSHGYQSPSSSSPHNHPSLKSSRETHHPSSSHHNNSPSKDNTLKSSRDGHYPSSHYINSSKEGHHNNSPSKLELSNTEVRHENNNNNNNKIVDFKRALTDSSATATTTTTTTAITPTVTTSTSHSFHFSPESGLAASAPTSPQTPHHQRTPTQSISKLSTDDESVDTSPKHKSRSARGLRSARNESREKLKAKISEPEQEVKMKMFEKMFKSSQNFVTILRTCEHSAVLKFFMTSILEEMRNKLCPPDTGSQERLNPEEMDIHEFQATLPQNKYLSSYIKPDSNIDEELDFALGILNLSHTKFINKFVLEFEVWANCHTVNLSYTSVGDSEMFALFLNLRESLTSLHLKGCTNLGKTTIQSMVKYCPKITYLALWETAQEDVLNEVVTLQNILFLDLSYCTITPAIFSKLYGKRYLDLSHCSSGERKWAAAVSDWARHQNNSKIPLQVLKLSSFASKNRLLTDSVMCDILSAATHLVSLDLSSCTSLTRVTLEKMKTLTKMQSLWINGLGFPIDDLLALLNSLPHLTEFQCKKGERLDRSHQMASALKNKPLTSLGLKGHDIDASIEDVFETSKKTLQKLSLGATLRSTLPDLAAKKLASCTNLIELRLQGCSMITSRTLQEILKNCTKICILDLSGCEVTDLSIEILFKNTGRYLHTLELNGCSKLTPKIVDEVLCRQKKLRVLSMAKECYCINPTNLVKLASKLTQLQILSVSTKMLPQSPDALSVLHKKVSEYLPYTVVTFK